MMIRLTERSGKVLDYADRSARSFNNNYIGTEHVLYGILEENGIAAQWLGEQGLTADRFEEVLARFTKIEPREVESREQSADRLYQLMTPRTKQMLNIAAREAQVRRQSEIEPEHMLLAILRDYDSLAVRLLKNMNVSVQKLYAAVSQILKLDDSQLEQLKEKAATKAETGSEDIPTLSQFSTDLTAMAANDEIDPIIGRQEEINRAMQILCRRTKNNPVLIGEPGVGKTAIAEGLAQKIVAGDVPEILAGKRLLMLDLSGMLAGAKYRGEFEERLKKGIEEATAAGNIILFIDEMHTLVGAGAAEGAMDASNILKPMLARGQLQVIGATTLDEYRKNIEKDAALERRFQPITVLEPTQDDSIRILSGLREKYEEHHKVKITDEAIEEAVKLSSRYITDRFLPDKAIDLIDEAASKLRMQQTSEPEVLRENEEKLSLLVQKKEDAVKAEEFEKAQELLEEEKKLREEVEKERDAFEKQKTEATPVLGIDDVADVVAAWTNIPVRKLTEDDHERLKNLEKELGKRVIGQDEAVHAVARAIRRGRLGLKDPNRPTGSFVFLGTTGVGKTELAKALADVMFGDEEAMVRVDMSEYMEKFDVSKLIGAPPGYVGYEEAGQLTEQVRRRPYSVVLFDEIEKAHPDVFNVLLQILEDGRLTDGQGRTVDFRNTIIIMTSNLGAGLLTGPGKKFGFEPEGGEEEAPAETQDNNLYGGHSYEEAKTMIMDEMKQTFKPEFINRIDEIIFFKMLDKDAMLQIVDIMLNQLAKRIADIGIRIEVEDDAKVWLADHGYEPQYGARPLRRLIQTEVEDTFSEAMLDDKVHEGETAIVSVKDDEIVVNAKGEEPAAAATEPEETEPAEAEAEEAVKENTEE